MYEIKEMTTEDWNWLRKNDSKNELCMAVVEMKYEMDDLFTADTLKLMATEQNWRRQNCKNFDEVDYAVLASVVAYDMEADNGRSWQYSTSEVLGFVTNAVVS